MTRDSSRWLRVLWQWKSFDDSHLSWVTWSKQGADGPSSWPQLPVPRGIGWSWKSRWMEELPEQSDRSSPGPWSSLPSGTKTEAKPRKRQGSYRLRRRNWAYTWWAAPRALVGIKTSRILMIEYIILPNILYKIDPGWLAGMLNPYPNCMRPLWFDRSFWPEISCPTVSPATVSPETAAFSPKEIFIISISIHLPIPASLKTSTEHPGEPITLLTQFDGGGHIVRRRRWCSGQRQESDGSHRREWIQLLCAHVDPRQSPWIHLRLRCPAPHLHGPAPSPARRHLRRLPGLCSLVLSRFSQLKHRFSSHYLLLVEAKIYTHMNIPLWLSSFGCLLHSLWSGQALIICVCDDEIAAPEFANSVQENHKKLTAALLDRAKEICAERGV